MDVTILTSVEDVGAASGPPTVCRISLLGNYQIVPTWPGSQDSEAVLSLCLTRLWGIGSAH